VPAAVLTIRPSSNFAVNAAGRSLVLATAVTSERHSYEPPVLREEGERRQLTVLFSDLVNSTEIAGRVDPEEWRDIVAD